MWRVIEGDCIEAMAAMDPASIDAIVTDPPYGIGFMGHEWDQPGVVVEPSAGKRRQRQPAAASGAGHARDRVPLSGHGKREGVRFGGPSDKDNTQHTLRGGAMHAGRYDLSPPAMLAFQIWTARWAAEALRVLKPGGHILVSGGTRTFHRMASGLEDAGFEIRDTLAWLYGSGFPKSLDVSKAIDKAAGVDTTADERWVATPHPVTGAMKTTKTRSDKIGQATPGERHLYAPSSEDAERWQGWGTALKPAFEPIVVARKPLGERNVAANVLRYGTGALNIDGARIEFQGEADEQESKAKNRHADFGNGARENRVYGTDNRERGEGGNYDATGRWPANVILDEEAAAILDEQTGETASSDRPRLRRRMTSAGLKGGGYGQGAAGPNEPEIDAPGIGYADTGGASRFFYCPKADRAERELGLEHHRRVPAQKWNEGGIKAAREETAVPSTNPHPTVKPVELMRWLVRLVTPPGGTVLDPFTGSGSTGIAALREGFDFVGIEREPEYVEIARDRIRGDAPMFNTDTEEVPA